MSSIAPCKPLYRTLRLASASSPGRGPSPIWAVRMCPLSLMISNPERVQVRCSGQQLEGSPLQVIHRACDLDRSLLFEGGQHAALLAYGFHCPADIGLGHLI